jgi:hypothetical protein
MPDGCRIIKISSALARIFDRHNDKDYILVWYLGTIVTYGGKQDIIRHIIAHWNKINMINRRKFFDSPQIAAVDRFEKSTQEFVNDFRKLSHSDIDLIRSMTENEAYSFPITKINNQPIERG